MASQPAFAGNMKGNTIKLTGLIKHIGNYTRIFTVHCS
jgi:hypothetical protein